MQIVPFSVIALRYFRYRTGIQPRQPVVDRHHEQQRQDDNRGPDGAACGQEKDAGILTTDNGFDNEKEQRRRIPERCV